MWGIPTTCRPIGDVEIHSQAPGWPPGSRQIPVLKTFIEPLLRGVGDPGNKRCGEFGFQRALGRKINVVKKNHDLTVLPSPGIMVSKGNHPKMTLFQVSEIL